METVARPNGGSSIEQLTEMVELERLSRQRPSILDHARAPMLDGIARYRASGMAPFSTPGHKMGVGADPELLALYGPDALMSDIPVSGGVDDIHFKWEIWRQAEELGADAWGSDRCFYLVNGSSAGNHAFLLSVLRPGDEVIVARDVHKSMMVALIHTGTKPIYVAPRLHPEQNVGLGIHRDDLAATLDAHPDAKLVILVSPSYCGVSSDLVGIAAVSHARGIPVYVDEAWGPHFHFHPALPASAMASGIDGAVASTHKVLGAITQSAVLNVQGPRIDPGRICSTVAMSQTTSPAAFILASIDTCRRQMMLQGEDLLGRTIELAQQARRRIQAIPGVSVLDADLLGITDYDLTKLVVDVHGIGLTGFELEEMLRFRFSIVPEMSDLTGIVCLITVGDTQESIDRLVEALQAVASERGPIPNGNGHGALYRSSGAVISPGVQAMTPRDAFYALTRTVPLAESIGQVSAELVIPYPPGIPVLAPGDVILPEKLDYLKTVAEMGVYISGASDRELQTIKVVDRPSGDA
jgi:arginine/lysine/ornithine decarboxylase